MKTALTVRFGSPSQTTATHVSEGERRAPLDLDARLCPRANVPCTIPILCKVGILHVSARISNELRKCPQITKEAKHFLRTNIF
jgi:hypothetical protein